MQSQRRRRAAQSAQTDALIEMYQNTTLEADEQVRELRKTADAMWARRAESVAREADADSICAHAELRMVHEHRLAMIRHNGRSETGFRGAPL